MKPATDEAIVIAGGHKGLTLAVYLQRAAMQVAVLERRYDEASAVFSSESTAPGFLHNLQPQHMESMECPSRSS